jgi:sirohydrochlorin ferrochelatase
MLEVAQQVTARLPEVAVEPAFLELAAPTILDAIARLARQGVRQVTVVPLLLFAAGHAKADIPLAVKHAASEHGVATVHMAGHLGCHPLMVELSTERCEQALATRPSVPADETLLLFVGRGSHDPDANSDLAKFARLRWEQTPVGRLETCYLAMTRPTLPEGLEFAATLPQRRVVIQPHLLFSGALAGRVADLAAQAAQRWPEKEWIVVEPLRTGEQISQVIVEQWLAANQPR